MIVYEFEESMLDSIIDELNNAQEHMKLSKKSLCDIEDMLFNLYEGGHSKEDDSRDYEYKTKEHDRIENRMKYRRSMRMRDNMDHYDRPYERMHMRSDSRYSY